MASKIINKDRFLNNIAKNLGREKNIIRVKKPMWQHQPQWNVLKDVSQDELVEYLQKQCKSIHTEFVRVKTDQLSKVINQIIQGKGGGTVVTWDDPRFTEYQINFWEGNLHTWNPKLGEENVKIAEKANIGITFSDITLAESGTVVLFSDTGKGRSVSLLPSVYIAIIPKSSIVPRMTQAAAIIEEKIANGEQVPSCINFISGPSNSADIEMNLIVGVHGPVSAVYVVVEDK